MDNSEGSQNAVQLALQTLKDRCHEYRHQVRRLEEENLALRLKCETTNKRNMDSLTEIDMLNAKITELNDQNSQHLRNNTMITTENRKLWSQLSTLCVANKTMGDHITKVNNYINEPYAQSHTPLIRSKTFTHETAPAKYSAKLQNEDSSLELEEVSLKTGDANNMDRPQILENIINSSFAFGFHNDTSNNSTIEYFESNLSDLKMLKDIILGQNDMLKTEVNNISNIKIDYKCGKCSKTHHKDDEKEAKIVDTRQYHAQQTEESVKSPKTNVLNLKDLPADMRQELDSLAYWATPENSNHFFNTPDIENKDSAIYDANDQICPICNELFSVSISFDVFQKHVEDHFLETTS